MVPAQHRKGNWSRVFRQPTEPAGAMREAIAPYGRNNAASLPEVQQPTALVANAASFGLLWAYRAGDANMRPGGLNSF